MVVMAVALALGGCSSQIAGSQGSCDDEDDRLVACCQECGGNWSKGQEVSGLEDCGAGLGPNSADASCALEGRGECAISCTFQPNSDAALYGCHCTGGDSGYYR